MDTIALWKKIEKYIGDYNALDIASGIGYAKFREYSFVFHSTAIEGSSLTELEIQLLLDKGLTAKGKPLSHHLMNTDLNAAYDHAIKAAHEKMPVTPLFLQHLNALVMKNTGAEHQGILGSWDSSKGEFRKHNVRAGSKIFVDCNKVEALVNEFSETLSQKLNNTNNLQEQYNLSFDAHINLVNIHPWSDGNGRTSRLLMNYIQYYFGLIPTLIFKEDRNEYINALNLSEKQNSNESFRFFAAAQFLKQLKKEIKEYQNSRNKGFSLMF